MKHRILKIILIFGFTISSWSAIISYLLKLNNYPIVTGVRIHKKNLYTNTYKYVE